MRRASLALVLALGCTAPSSGDDELGGTETDASSSEGTQTDSSASTDTSTSTETGEATDTDTGSETGEPEPARVLFIGNSYTFFNDLPSLFAAMTEAAGDPRMVDSIATAGATVANHVNDPQVAATLAEGWDVVVIQGQSVEPIVAYEGFEQGVLDLAALIDETSPGAELLLFETWAREEGNSVLGDLGMTAEQMQQALSEGYAQAAQASGGTVVPVGQAWALALDQVPRVDLFTSDGSHPSVAGSFLSLCVFFGAITSGEAASSDYVPGSLSPADADLLEPIADALTQP
jgi:hypothetical protein